MQTFRNIFAKKTKKHKKTTFFAKKFSFIRNNPLYGSDISASPSVRRSRDARP